MVSLPLLSTVIELTVISVVCDGSKIANQHEVEACSGKRETRGIPTREIALINCSWRLAPSWRSNNKCYVFRSVCSVIKVTTTTNT